MKSYVIGMFLVFLFHGFCPAAGFSVKESTSTATEDSYAPKPASRNHVKTGGAGITAGQAFTGISKSSGASRGALDGSSPILKANSACNSSPKARILDHFGTLGKEHTGVSFKYNFTELNEVIAFKVKTDNDDSYGVIAVEAYCGHSLSLSPCPGGFGDAPKKMKCSGRAGMASQLTYIQGKTTPAADKYNWCHIEKNSTYYVNVRVGKWGHYPYPCEAQVIIWPQTHKKE